MVAVAGAAAFLVLAVLLVPWDPVPGRALHPVSASSVFTTEEIRRAEDFSSLARIWSWCSLGVSLVLACVLGFTELGARLVDRVRGPWWWRVVVAVVGLAVAGRVVTLPFAVLLRRRVLEYGLSDQAWSAYAVDLLKGLGVNVVATSIVMVVLVGTARRWPRAWPAVAGLLLAGLVMLGSFVYPLLVEPLFNHFEPLPDGPLRTRILALADEEGVHVDDVLVADASRRTTTLNAYVSGFGSSRRVVVYDNLVDDVDDPQVVSVVAHELGHARHDDVLTGSLLGAAGALLGVGPARPADGWGSRRAAPRAPGARPGRGGVPARRPRGERHQPPDRDPRGRRRAAGHRRPGGVHRGAEGARPEVPGRPDPAGPLAVWFGSHPTGLTRIALAERFAEEP